MHDNLIDFCQQLFNSGFNHSIITNATLMTPSLARKFKSLRTNVIVSLDSPCHEINCMTRSKTIDTLSGIECLLAKDVPVAINTVVSRHNIDSCTEVIEQFYPRIRRFSFLRLIARSHDDSIVQDLLLYSSIQLQALGAKLGEWKDRHPDIKIISPFNFPKGDNACFQEALEAPGCLAGTSYLTIKPNLDIVPCSYAQQLVVGNLTRDSFESIWNGSDLRELRSGSALPCAIMLTPPSPLHRFPEAPPVP